MPRHVQVGFLAQFVENFVEGACTSVDNKSWERTEQIVDNPEAADVSAAALKELIEGRAYEINHTWSKILEDMAKQEMKLCIERLLLDMVPLATLDRQHPVHNLLGNRFNAESSLNSVVSWYNVAFTFFEELSRKIESDEVNLTQVWAAGPDNIDRVLAVLGQEPSFNVYDEGHHTPKAPAQPFFLKQGTNEERTATGTDTRDVLWRMDRETFPIPILKMKKTAPAQHENYSWAPCAEVLSMDDVYKHLQLCGFADTSAREATHTHTHTPKRVLPQWRETSSHACNAMGPEERGLRKNQNPHQHLQPPPPFQGGWSLPARRHR